MTRSPGWLVIVGVAAVLWAGTVLAAPTDPEVDLAHRDREILEQFGRRYPVDTRYDEVLNRIAFRIDPSVAQVFPQAEERRVRYAVFLSQIGFNAIALDRLILIDTLMLDGLRRFSQGIAVCGQARNAYTDELAQYIVRLGTGGGFGLPLRQGIDPGNPYRIPPPPGISLETDRQSEFIFEEVLAAWICHEMAHAYLGHAREKLAGAAELRRELEGEKLHPLLVQQRIEHHLTFDLGPAKELEADREGARLALLAGYDSDGFRRWYTLLERIEHFAGMDSALLRTHPRPADRWRAVKEVERSMSADAPDGHKVKTDASERPHPR